RLLYPYTLFLHDALPICAGDDTVTVRNSVNYSEARDKAIFKEIYNASLKYTGDYQDDVRSWYEESKDALAKLPDNNYIINLGERSEEHTSELQSRFDLVC